MTAVLKFNARGATLLEHLRHYMPEDPSANECWEWSGCRNDDGYGVLAHENRNLTAHRVAYELFVEPVPTGLWVLHCCDNPPCCNPAHLYAGTAAENTRDMISRGRSKLGLKPKKLRCIADHELSGENVYVTKRGTRHCKECANRRTREARERRRAKT